MKSRKQVSLVDCGRYRQSGPRPDTRLLRHPALEGVTRSARTDSPRRIGRNEFRQLKAAATALGGGGGGFVRGEGGGGCFRVRLRIQLAVGPQPLRLRNHNSGLAHRIMVKRLAISPHDPLGITDSACKNQLVVVSVQYGPFNPYIPIRSMTIGKSRVAIDPIAMHTSWRSNSDIASVTSRRLMTPTCDWMLLHTTSLPLASGCKLPADSCDWMTSLMTSSTTNPSAESQHDVASAFALRFIC
ncbi:hypothetical protein F511_26073 [Dorcoceras hygrometricum]|uniref:Uncharacterized protein n=1 Tax=Dorcoceras hygrometricum TaxID=472368 RepID=A0A2Z7AKJ5_9LAMI|nr:hypothetical protein F511_26073 [Dorcoceras hygrometricum]